MKTPRPRRLAAIVVGALLYLAARGPWPDGDFKDLRDSVGDHGSRLSAGHASLGAGASSCVFCHFPHQTKALRPLWLKEGKHDNADFGRDSLQGGASKSELCMSCHDGAVAPSLRAHFIDSSDDGSQSHASGAGSNHPVGADYLAAFRRDPESYNDPTLNPKIFLEEGKVGCVSCHATHDLSAVSVSSVRREVCIECHRR
ncbi:MAG: hypothetical protein A2V88_12540 [Elusimicrobia bacterium RBG_16_66_12]|nr:MAG: hypothetical protein A2V88_12540 [Elusimicrobia bacterium RBG_16_66_12]